MTAHNERKNERQKLIGAKYILDTPFPRGASGETWLAVGTNGHPLVIKMPSIDDPTVKREIQKKDIAHEIKTLKTLNKLSKSVIRIIDNGDFSYLNTRYPYLVTEVAPGENLGEIITQAVKQGEDIPSLEMLEIFDLVLEVIEKAHAQNIIYNDVDVKHIFWNRECSEHLAQSTHERMRIIDWGNATDANDEFKSPEITFASDIRQCGSFLSDIFTAFGNISDDEIPNDVLRLIQKLRDPASGERFTSISQIRSALKSLINKRRDDINAVIEEVQGRLNQVGLSLNSGDISFETYCSQIDKELAFLEVIRNSRHKCYTKLLRTQDTIRERVVLQALRTFTKDFASANHADWEFLNLANQYLDGLTCLSLSYSSLHNLLNYVKQSANRCLEISSANSVSQDAIARTTNSWKELTASTARISDLKSVEQIVIDILLAPADSYYLWLDMLPITKMLIQCAQVTTYLSSTLDFALAEVAHSLLNENEPLTEDVKGNFGLIQGWPNGAKDYPLSPIYHKIAQQVSLNGDVAGEIAQNLEGIETLKTRPSDELLQRMVWHRSILKIYLDHFSEIYEQRVALRKFMLPVTGQIVATGDDLDQWIAFYRRLLDTWTVLCKNPTIEEERDKLNLIGHGLKRLRDAIERGDLVHAQKACADISDDMAFLSPGSGTEYVGKLQRSLQICRETHDPRTVLTTSISSRESLEKWRKWQKTITEIFNIEIKLNSFNSSRLKSLASALPSLPTEHNGNTDSYSIFEPLVYVCEHTNETTLGSEDDVALLTQYINLLPDVPLRNSLRQVIRTREDQRIVNSVSSFTKLEKALQLVAPNSPDRKNLQRLVDFKKLWEDGNFPKSEIECDKLVEWVRTSYPKGALASFINQLNEKHAGAYKAFRELISLAKELDTRPGELKETRLSESDETRISELLQSILDNIPEQLNDAVFAGWKETFYRLESIRARARTDENIVLSLGDEFRNLESQAKIQHDPLWSIYRKYSKQRNPKGPGKLEPLSLMLVFVLLILAGIGMTFTVSSIRSQAERQATEQMIYVLSLQTHTPTKTNSATSTYTPISTSTPTAITPTITGTLTQTPIETPIAVPVGQGTVTPDVSHLSGTISPSSTANMPLRNTSGSSMPPLTALPTVTPGISTPTALACQALPSRLSIGQNGKVVGLLNLRDEPNRQSKVIDKLTSGAIVEIQAGPTCTNDNILWWQVKVSSSNQKGWLAEADMKVYYVEPVSR